MIMTDHHVNGMEVVPSRKESNCVRCRNHGLKIILRGHKQYCPYAACTCEKCRFTAEQQRQMRLQNAIRRAEAAERGSGMTRRPRSSATATSMVQTSAQQTQQQPPPPPPLPQQIVVTVQNAQQNGTTGMGFSLFLFFSVINAYSLLRIVFTMNLSLFSHSALCTYKILFIYLSLFISLLYLLNSLSREL
jgi:hypothetical protein